MWLGSPSAVDGGGLIYIYSPASTRMQKIYAGSKTGARDMYLAQSRMRTSTHFSSDRVEIGRDTREECDLDCSTHQAYTSRSL